MPSPVGPRAPAPPVAAPRTVPAPATRPHHDRALQPVERPVSSRLLLLPWLLRAGAGEGVARPPPGARGWDPRPLGHGPRSWEPQRREAAQGLAGQGAAGCGAAGGGGVAPASPLGTGRSSG